MLYCAHYRLTLVPLTICQVCQLMSEMGFDTYDTRAVKKSDTTGAELLLMSERDLMLQLSLPKHKARRLRKIQDAVALYDVIATRVAQPRISEIELRLWLAGQVMGSSLQHTGVM